MPIKLSDLLSPECIELKLAGRKKREIIRELVDVISRGDGIADGEALFNSLMEREQMGSTGIGNGIAIPHAMIPGMNTARIAFGRKPGGAKFDSVDNQPASLFFLLAGPEDNPGLHLKVLSKLARYLHDESFRHALLNAETPSDVVEAFKNKDLH
jgi:fructose-specific phosphotransferase system IIA component